VNGSLLRFFSNIPELARFPENAFIDGFDCRVFAIEMLGDSKFSQYFLPLSSLVIEQVYVNYESNARKILPKPGRIQRLIKQSL
jgi:hypothetical protein